MLLAMVGDDFASTPQGRDRERGRCGRTEKLAGADAEDEHIRLASAGEECMQSELPIVVSGTGNARDVNKKPGGQRLL